MSACCSQSIMTPLPPSLDTDPVLMSGCSRPSRAPSVGSNRPSTVCLAFVLVPVCLLSNPPPLSLFVCHTLLTFFSSSRGGISYFHPSFALYLVRNCLLLFSPSLSLTLTYTHTHSLSLSLLLYFSLSIVLFLAHHLFLILLIVYSFLLPR